MNTEKTKLYCIWGLAKAAESFARDKESHEALIQELKKNHIPETINLITEESFHSIMAERCAPRCLFKVIGAIVSKYEKLEFNASIENCTGCGTILNGGV